MATLGFSHRPAPVRARPAARAWSPSSTAGCACVRGEAASPAADIVAADRSPATCAKPRLTAAAVVRLFDAARERRSSSWTPTLGTALCGGLARAPAGGPGAAPVARARRLRAAQRARPAQCRLRAVPAPARRDRRRHRARAGRAAGRRAVHPGVPDQPRDFSPLREQRLAFEYFPFRSTKRHRRRSRAGPPIFQATLELTMRRWGVRQIVLPVSPQPRTRRSSGWSRRCWPSSRADEAELVLAPSAGAARRWSHDARWPRLACGTGSDWRRPPAAPWALASGPLPAAGSWSRSPPAWRRAHRHEPPIAALAAAIDAGDAALELRSPARRLAEERGRTDLALRHWQRVLAPHRTIWSATRPRPRAARRGPLRRGRDRLPARRSPRRPEDPRRAAELARIAHDAGDPVEAESRWHAALLAHPGQSAALLGLAQALTAQHRFADAAALLSELAAPSPPRGALPPCPHAAGRGRCRGGRRTMRALLVEPWPPGSIPRCCSAGCLRPRVRCTRPPGSTAVSRPSSPRQRSPCSRRRSWPPDGAISPRRGPVRPRLGRAPRQCRGPARPRRARWPSSGLADEGRSRRRRPPHWPRTSRGPFSAEPRWRSCWVGWTRHGWPCSRPAPPCPAPEPLLQLAQLALRHGHAAAAAAAARAPAGRAPAPACRHG